MKQLEFFPPTLEERLMEFENRMTRERKALFGQNSQLKKELSETRHELDKLKRALCRTGTDLF